VTATIKRLIAGELESGELATPDSYTDKSGTGFDKQRNPNWFQGLYGKALSRVCLSARIPADLYDALQSINNWQDTLRKALHKLVESFTPERIAKEERERANRELKASRVGIPSFDEAPSFDLFFHPEGAEYKKLVAVLTKMNAGVFPHYMFPPVDAIFENLDQALFTKAGQDESMLELRHWSGKLQESRSRNQSPKIELANHCLRGMRAVRKELAAMMPNV
jgi:hypothetical protein